MIAVQERFAAVVGARLRGDDLVWVHDYHLLGLGAALRRRGARARLGFFLHTPFPPLDLWAILPRARGFLEALLAYDLVGFHTAGYVEMQTLTARGIPVVAFNEDKADLEDVFMRITQGIVS